MQAKATGDSLLLSVRFPLSLSPAPEVALSLTPAVQAPVQRAPRYMGAWTEQGLSASAFLVASVESSWQCRWNAALKKSPESWSFELQVPYTEIGWFPGEAHPIKRMRLNLQIRGAAANGTRDTLVAWGFPVLNQVEHGVLLEVSFP